MKKITPSFNSALRGLAVFSLLCGGVFVWKWSVPGPSPAVAPASRPEPSVVAAGPVTDAPLSRPSAGAMKAGEIPDDLWQALGTARRAIRPLDGDEGQAAHYAHHPEQRLTARFRPQGVALQPAGKGDWEMTLTSTSAGAGSTISIDGTRAEYRHPDGVVEWFENRPEGIEHGFTIGRKPVGDEGIELTVKLSGMTPEPAGEGGDLLLRTPDGQPRLLYSGLKVWDAEGDALPATMAAVGDDIRIAVNDHGATYPVTVDPLITSYRERIDMQQPALGDSHNQFGEALAFDGEFALVGVPHDNTLAGPHSGSVYVFKRDGGSWTHEAWLTPGDALQWDQFGAAIVLQGDTAFIGAPGAAAGGGVNDNRGYVYVFRRESGSWTQEAVLQGSSPASSGGFGAALAVDGGRLLIGAPGVTYGGNPVPPPLGGSAYVFDKTGDTWSESAKLAMPDGATGDHFGWAVALEGDLALVSAPDDDASGGMMEGSVHLYVLTGESWVVTQTLRMTGTTSDARFGSAIDLEGSTLLIGAPYENGTGSGRGGAFVFTESSGNWSFQTRLGPSAPGVIGFGRAVLLEGDQAIIGAPGWEWISPNPPGSVHFFHREQNQWTEGDPLTLINGHAGAAFGYPLALGGPNLLVGMGTAGSYSDYTINGAESIVVYAGSGDTWQPEATLRPTDGGDESYHGAAVAIDGDRCVIGLPFDDSGVNDYRHGSAYILSREWGVWMLERRLTHPQPFVTAEFGLAVAIEDDLAVIGSLDGAFAYRRDGETWSLEKSLTPSFRAPDDKFGAAVAISQGRIAVGAPFIHYRSFGSNGKAFVFAPDSGPGWQQIAMLEAGQAYPANHRGDLFGEALAFEGDRLLVGAPSRDVFSYPGHAYVFTAGHAGWTKEATLVRPEGELFDSFGAAVALDGDQMLIGAPGHHSAYLYLRQSGEWTLQQTLTIPESGSDSRFGAAVALDGRLALVGAPRFARVFFEEGPVTPGTAHLFEAGDDGLWSERMILRGDSTTGDAFGLSLAMDGMRALVGAPWDEFPSSPTGNVSPDQGSVYFFEIGSEFSMFIGQFDTDLDGVLSEEEWRWVYPTPPRKETAFAVIDVDGSGTLDEAELRAARHDKRTAKTLGLWLGRASAFVELDTDQDGEVTRAEIAPMWLPGTDPKVIDATWKRLEEGGGTYFLAWIRASALPSLKTFEAAKKLRAERRTLFHQLDGDDDDLVSRSEFAQLFRPGSRDKTIESAWRSVTGVAKPQPSPASIELAAFIEARKVPEPAWE